ncbi:MAG: histidine kinase [Bacteroidota bacterium]
MRLKKSAYEWLFKYKIHHLVFWTLYHYFWWNFYVIRDKSVFEALQEPFQLFRFCSFVIIQALGVYFCLYFLIPKYLEKGKYLSFIVSVFLTIGAMSLLILTGILIGARIQGAPATELMPYTSISNFYILKKDAFPSSLSSMTLGLSIKLGKNWIDAQRRQRELEQEKLKSELQFLKSQFNPHFLFNTINSIFVLINKNSQLASESLSKFSDLLRYQLYECNEHVIPLKKELGFIESFLSLERLRHDKSVSITTRFEGTQNAQLAIAPFLLMPFIENAFKHFNPTKETPNWVDLQFSLEGNQFVFVVSNSLSSHKNTAKDAMQFNGLGLKNVKRRLELLYPETHELNIEQREDSYKVRLHLKLTDLRQTVQIAEAI